MFHAFRLKYIIILSGSYLISRLSTTLVTPVYSDNHLIQNFSVLPHLDYTRSNSGGTLAIDGFSFILGEVNAFYLILTHFISFLRFFFISYVLYLFLACFIHFSCVYLFHTHFIYFSHIHLYFSRNFYLTHFQISIVAG